MNRPEQRHSPADRFLWAVGIEDTAIGTTIRNVGRRLDEYELTDHYRRWREDLDLVADLGCTAIRYGLPWYRVNPALDVWEWSWLDRAVEYAAVDCNLVVIADLVHYGTPTWLPGAFTDPAYPEAVAAFADAVSTRYGDLIRYYTPLNEPLVTASFCGQRGIWPPYETGDRGWVRVVLNVVSGIQRTITAIRSAQPAASIVHVEAAQLWSTQVPELAYQVAHHTKQSFVPTDLLMGRVTEDHSLYHWLIEAGATAERLQHLCENAQTPDIVGVNYYPQLSGRELVRHNGGIIQVAIDRGRDGLVATLSDFHARYGLPVLLSETGSDGTPDAHRTWLHQSTAALTDLRHEGIPVVGFTWWPLFDFVDWSWASAGSVVEEFHTREPADDPNGQITPVQSRGGPAADVRAFLRSMGLYRLGGSDGALDRIPTDAVKVFRDLIAANKGESG